MQDGITRAAHTNPYSDEVILKQKELIRSFEAKALAFRSVITNKGSNTPGNDGIILKKRDFPQVIEQLSNLRTYKSGKVKRVWIPKANSDNMRPLSIPNQIDRVWQKLFSLAIEPVIFHMNCPRSYGYLKHRSCRDAVIYLKSCLNLKWKGKNVSALYVLEADIKGFFDNISHR
jgi:RNA-directed DNA polymerase